MSQGRYIASIEHGRADETPAKLPAKLRKALAAAAAGTLDDAGLFRAITPYLRASFVAENIGGIESLFTVTEDLEAVEIEVHKVELHDDALPAITASARFIIEEVEVLDDDALMAWQEDNDFLTDAVTFFWQIGDEEIVIGDHEGAGFEREAADDDGSDDDGNDDDDGSDDDE